MKYLFETFSLLLIITCAPMKKNSNHTHVVVVSHARKSIAVSKNFNPQKGSWAKKKMLSQKNAEKTQKKHRNSEHARLVRGGPEI